jgi:hypothetical protein
VTEAINFFVSAYNFGLINAMMGVRQMLVLIFSRENAIQVLEDASFLKKIFLFKKNLIGQILANVLL